MSRYAAQTSVPVERSRAEIERTLSRYKADQFAYIQQPGRARVQFVIGRYGVQFDLPLPDRNAKEYTHTPGRAKRRHSDDAARAWEQGCRQRWRALALAIKAKLEAVEAGITTFEEEFLAHLMLPNGRTVGQHTLPQIRLGVMPNKLMIEASKG